MIIKFGIIILAFLSLNAFALNVSKDCSARIKEYNLELKSYLEENSQLMKEVKTTKWLPSIYSKNYLLSRNATNKSAKRNIRLLKKYHCSTPISHNGLNNLILSKKIDRLTYYNLTRVNSSDLTNTDKLRLFVELQNDSSTKLLESLD